MFHYDAMANEYLKGQYCYHVSGFGLNQNIHGYDSIILAMNHFFNFSVHFLHTITSTLEPQQYMHHMNGALYSI